MIVVIKIFGQFILQDSHILHWIIVFKDILLKGNEFTEQESDSYWKALATHIHI